MAVDVTTGKTFSIGERKALVSGDYVDDLSHANYDVAPDGAHLLMLRRSGEESRAIVVLNWVREVELKRSPQGAR